MRRASALDVGRRSEGLEGAGRGVVVSEQFRGTCNVYVRKNQCSVMKLKR